MLYHLAVAAEWEASGDDGYLPSAFAREGFVHMSGAHQVRRTAERLYPGRDDLVLLVLDATRLDHLVWEGGSHGEGSRFPHHYAPIPRAGVLDAVRLTPAGPTYVELDAMAVLTSASGTIAELWRYPVKSMRGEPLRTVAVGPGGLEGDRRFGVVTPSGHVLSAKSERRLLDASASWLGDAGAEVVEVTLPDGAVHRSDDVDTDEALSRWLGRDVRLHRAGADERHTVRMEDDEHPEGIEFATQPGVFYDSSSTVHLLSDGALRAGRALHPAGQWDPRRFRPNIVVALDGDEAAEDSWVERDIRVGALPAWVRKRTNRCVVTTRAQPRAVTGAAALDVDVDILRSLLRARAGDLGVYLRPDAAGTISVGDAIEV